METEIFSFYMRLPKEYAKLLRKAENLMRDILSISPDSLSTGFSDTIFLPAGGQFGPIRFINTCVPDSFLIALYNCYVHNNNIASLFNFSEKLRAPMVFLRNCMYNEAKASWLFWSQFNVPIQHTARVIVTDAWSAPGDHLEIFSDLKVNNKKLSKFDELGNVYAMGFSDEDPLLILVDVDPGTDAPLPKYIDDDYYRTFELNFLLMSKPEHMTAALNIFDRWVLYDDLETSYEDFDSNFREGLTVQLAGYVKTHEKYGVSEEGYCGTIPFNPPREKEHLD